jgi:hypothetical protein
VAWCTGLLIWHRDRINEFIGLEKELSHCILFENHSRSIEILDEIDRICGISIWSISLRVSILKSAEKFDEASIFEKEIINFHSENGFFVAIVRNNISQKQDPALSFSRGGIIRRQIIRDFHGPIKDFLLYRIVPKDFIFDEWIEYKGVLEYEKDCSLIDAFKAMIEFLCNELSDRPSNSSIAETTTRRLSGKISSPFIRNLGIYYGINFEPECNAHEYELLDLYTCGKHDDFVEKAHENPRIVSNFAFYELYIKALISCESKPKDTLFPYISERLIDILTRKDSQQRALTDILSICDSYSGISWFRELHLFIFKKTSFLDHDAFNYITRLSAALSSFDSPQKGLILSKFQNGKEFIEACQRVTHGSITLESLKAIHFNEEPKLPEHLKDSIKEERLLKYQAQHFIRVGDLYSAIDQLKILSKHRNVLLRYYALNKLSLIYLDIGSPEKAIEIFVASALNNKNLISIFNSQKICSAAELIIQTAPTIDAVIALSLHSRFIDDEFDSALKFSFDQIISAYSFESPLDLNKTSISEEKLFYFFEFVCVPYVMKISLYFESIEEIENCRINVCNFLISKDVSKESLIDEVKEITKEQVIREAAQHVEQSRINADTSSFRDSRSNIYRSAFSRFVDLKKSKDYSQYEDDRVFIDLIRAIPKEMLYESGAGVYLLGTPLNEKNAAFNSLVEMLRDEFTFGEKGLNSYLSTRIRHGVLPNAIRGAISDDNLLSPVDTKTGSPAENTAWKERLFKLKKKEWSRISDALKKFTTNFEGLIKEVNDDWLQITSLSTEITQMHRTKKTPTALFNYTLSSLESFAIQNEVIDNEYDTLAREVSTWLWAKTESNLKQVREKLKSVALFKFSLFLDELSNEISEISDDEEKVALLKDAIARGKVSLQNTFNQVLSWFTRAEVTEIPTFNMATAIEIAARSANVSVESEKMSNLEFSGRNLAHFVDILYILFENAVTKSNLGKENLNVSISVDEMEQDLCIKVKNNCLPIDNPDNENASLNFYREGLQVKDITNQLAQTEGGTGIFKIGKTLRNDIEIESNLEFGFLDNQTFEVNILMKGGIEALCDESTYS